MYFVQSNIQHVSPASGVFAQDPHRVSAPGIIEMWSTTVEIKQCDYATNRKCYTLSRKQKKICVTVKFSYFYKNTNVKITHENSETFENAVWHAICHKISPTTHNSNKRSWSMIIQTSWTVDLRSKRVNSMRHGRRLFNKSCVLVLPNTAATQYRPPGPRGSSHLRPTTLAPSPSTLLPFSSKGTSMLHCWWSICYTAQQNEQLERFNRIQRSSSAQ